MSPKQRSRTPLHAPMYQQLVLFPERAEYLAEERFESYRVSLDHWKVLAETFRVAFETVYERRSARVLLVHGGQGHGKSLFVRKLVDDFKGSKGSMERDAGNLWHVLSEGPSASIETVRRAVDTTVLRRVEARPAWLADERKFALTDTHEMRVFLFDDAHKDAFVREWAELSQGEYSRLRAEGKRGVVLESVAQRLVEDCRGDFRRSLFVLLSNDSEYLDQLRDQLDRSHKGLSERVELPLPAPDLKEQIVRTNTNILNQRSYWFCLDQGGPDEKKDAYQTLMGDRGFIDAFQAISSALAAQHHAKQAKRLGRPANKNLLTLVTLGTLPAVVASFISDRELEPDESNEHDHVGVWWFRNRWASALDPEPGGAQSRRASLVESEFALRWVALDMVATWALCTAPADDDIASKLIDIMRAAPKVGEKKEVRARLIDLVRTADDGLHKRANAPELAAFEERFTSRGHQRSLEYEPAIAKRMGRALSKGLEVRGALKPDFIIKEYEPCAVTRASSADDKAIDLAISRGCHVIEMTAHLQDDMRGLDAYLSDKVRVYAELLESV